MGWFWIALLAMAVAVLILAEWPRLAARLPARERPDRRDRRRGRRPDLRVVTDDGDDSDDFAASVERDLARLPTVPERDPNR